MSPRPLPFGFGGALAAQPLDRAVLGPGADLDLLRPVQGRHLDRAAAQRLGDRDRHRHLEVAAVEPLEDRRGGDPGGHVEVAGRAAARAGLALAGEPDPRPVLDPGRDVDLVALGLLGQAGAAAGRAGVLDDLAGAAALRAGLADREEALALGVDAAAFAARAGDRAGARFGAAAVAGRAALGLRHGDADLGAVDRLVEAEADLGFEVAAAHLLRLRPAAAAAAAEEVGEDVAEVDAAEAAAGTAGPNGPPPPGPPPPKPPNIPPGVVLLALLGIGERVVGALDLLELLLRRRVVGVAVRVVLARQLPVRLLDLLLGGLLGDARAPCRARQPTAPTRSPPPAPAGSTARRAGSPSASPRRPSPTRPPRRGCVESASCCFGIELLPLRIDRLDPVPRQRVPQAPEDEQDAMGQPVLGVPLRIQPSRLKRPLQVVEHRHHLPKHLSLPASRRSLNLRRHPLPEVLEVGLRPLGEIEVLVPLPLSVSQQRVEVLLDLRSDASPAGGGVGGPPRGRFSDRRAAGPLPATGPAADGLPSLDRPVDSPHLSSPSSTTSASTTSSSSAETRPRRTPRQPTPRCSACAAA